VSPRALTAPPTDRRYWRRLLRLVHPDQGGSDDLFVWVRHLQEHVAGDGVEPPRREYTPPRRTTTAESPRVPYEAAFDRAGSFDDLTRHALTVADRGDVPEPYARLLLLLVDCYGVGETGGVVYRQQHQGATYKQLAAIGHRVGMDKVERTRWYRIAEGIPLSQRHAGHIIDRLQERAA
jgi:hypothetical protein